MRADTPPKPVGHALPHESAALHVSGAAHYLDDLPELAGQCAPPAAPPGRPIVPTGILCRQTPRPYAGS